MVRAEEVEKGLEIAAVGLKGVAGDAALALQPGHPGRDGLGQSFHVGGAGAQLFSGWGSSSHART